MLVTVCGSCPQAALVRFELYIATKFANLSLSTEKIEILAVKIRTRAFPGGHQPKDNSHKDKEGHQRYGYGQK